MPLGKAGGFPLAPRQESSYEHAMASPLAAARELLKLPAILQGVIALMTTGICLAGWGYLRLDSALSLVGWGLFLAGYAGAWADFFLRPAPRGDLATDFHLRLVLGSIAALLPVALAILISAGFIAYDGVKSGAAAAGKTALRLGHGCLLYYGVGLVIILLSRGPGSGLAKLAERSKSV
jgi:hypothetical protein